jgi:hypothetical protein
MWKKINYYTSDYWMSYWFTEIVWNTSYFYDYDENSNEIIVKYWKNRINNELVCVEELTDKQKNDLVETFFKS